MPDVKSFDALLEEISDINEILKTLECYEEKGVIDYFLFTKVIDKGIDKGIDMGLLYLKELSTAFTHMQRGLERQIEKNESLEDGLAYLQAMNYIAGKYMEKTDSIDLMPESTADNSNFTYLNGELFLAHLNKDRQHLKNALFEFTEYVRDVKKELLEDTSNTFYWKKEKCNISFHDYLYHILQTTGDLEIIEGPTIEN